jgi:serine/threonine-protein kinase SRPK3
MIEPSQLYQKFGDPILNPIVRVGRKPLPAGVPTHVVGPARIGIRSDEITPTYLPIMLSDFGSSYYPSKTRRTNAHTLPHLVPPEIFFLDKQKDEDNLSFPSEIWTLGCTIFEIIGSGGPFSTLGGGILQDQVSVLGKLPDPWWSQWGSRADFFNEDATIDITTGAPFQDSLEERYDWFVNAARRRSDMEEQGEDEKKAFLHMIWMMLRYLPSDRATIQNVVESEWMQKWAFPAKAGIK